MATESDIVMKNVGKYILDNILWAWPLLFDELGTNT